MSWEDFADRLDGVRETRARLPELFRNRHASRRRRPLIRHSGLITLVEATESARGQLAVGDDPRALIDRDQLLFRLASALERPDVDGIIATADVIEDLLMLEVLDEKLVIGIMNAGGPLGSASAHDGAFTGYDAQTIADGHLDGGSLRVQIDAGDADAGARLAAVGAAASALAGSGVMALVEAEWLGEEGAGASTDDRIRAAQIAAGIGARSSYRWLLLSMTDDLEEVIRATTLPVLLRYPSSPDARTVTRVSEQLARPGIGGVVLPASTLFADPADPCGGVARAMEIVRPPSAPEGAP